MSDTKKDKTEELQVSDKQRHGVLSVSVETKRKKVAVPATQVGQKHSQNRPAGISDAEMERRLGALRAAKAREAAEAASRELDAKGEPKKTPVSKTVSSQRRSIMEAAQAKRVVGSSTQKPASESPSGNTEPEQPPRETTYVSDEDVFLSFVMSAIQKETAALKVTAEKMDRVARMVLAIV